MSLLDNPAIKARCEMFVTRYEATAKEATAKDMIREAAEEFAITVTRMLSQVDCDTGRAIAALDLIQQAKNVAIDAIVLKQAIKNLK